MNSAIAIEIEQRWLTTAQQFAAEQSAIVDQTQIFLNTLAVYGLQQYLGWGNIQSSLTESYSWHPQTRVLTKWSDLYLPDYGRVMALPKLDNLDQNIILLPEILPLGCVGGVVIELNPEFTTLTLQGFISEQQLYGVEKLIDITNLEPIDQLFDALFLRAEERLLITEEITSYLEENNELKNDFQDLLTEEGIIDLINRLNYLYYQQDVGQDVMAELIFDREQPEESAPLILREPAMRYASDLFAKDPDFNQQNPAELAIAALTERLLEKISELRNNF